MQTDPLQRKQPGAAFVRVALIFYGLMAAAALIWIWLRTGEPLEPLIPNAARSRPITEAGLFLSAFLLNMVFDLKGPEWWNSIQKFQHSLKEVLVPLTWPQILLLSLSSAAAEELLFRGALQPVVGLIPASIIFALSHFPLKREMWIWPFYAFAMGLILGLLKLWGGDIWTAVLLHFGINFVSLSLLSRRERTEKF